MLRSPKNNEETIHYITAEAITNQNARENVHSQAKLGLACRCKPLRARVYELEKCTAKSLKNLVLVH